MGVYAVAVVNRFGGATVSNNTMVVIQPKGGRIDTKQSEIIGMDEIKGYILSGLELTSLPSSMRVEKFTNSCLHGRTWS